MILCPVQMFAPLVNCKSRIDDAISSIKSPKNNTINGKPGEFD